MSRETEGGNLWLNVVGMCFGKRSGDLNDYVYV